jgi:hypothetical protein
MITAVMQPYLFPYIGYYQLVLSSDFFVFYDDVNYIKRGYVNRNNILLDGVAHRFTLPVPSASQNTLICNLKFSDEVRKIIETINHAYKKAPYFSDVMPIIEEVLTQKDRDITSVCIAGIELVFDYLSIDSPKLLRSTDIAYNRNKSAAEKLIAITKELSCSEYVNSPGGRELYGKNYFLSENVTLHFIEPKIEEYLQGDSEFIPYLSIIDVLMWCSKKEAIRLLNLYRLT